VQFDDVFILKDEVAVDHLALERQGTLPPDPGILEFLEEVLVDGPGQVDDRRPPFQREWIVVVGLLAGDLAVGPDDIEKQEYFFSQVFEAVAALSRCRGKAVALAEILLEKSQILLGLGAVALVRDKECLFDKTSGSRRLAGILCSQLQPLLLELR